MQRLAITDLEKILARASDLRRGKRRVELIAILLS